MLTYFVAMDSDGVLYMATRDDGGGVFWERLPLVPGAMAFGEPLDPLDIPIPVPDWAIDSYVFFPCDGEFLVNAFDDEGEQFCEAM